MHLLNKLKLFAEKSTSLRVLGDLYTFHITGDQTGGAFTITEGCIQPGSAPPRHIHHLEDEAFYVLDGQFSFVRGKQQIEAGAGHFIHIPKGTLHTFRNVGKTKGRLLTMLSPAGLEKYFFEIGSEATGSLPPNDPSVIEKVIGLASASTSG
ncbi:cupin domain-containing protein [Danxiaibacter flavus]|uniref:Cupin domain-containing protein n=1 Tax=Danxiaibacter flavus TaxID=3049108 RepID=A0ABV3Z8Q2_9BACT|nr:cupin domain-containing protein [Chitinophagaceae bacterium DXS]